MTTIAMPIAKELFQDWFRNMDININMHIEYTILLTPNKRNHKLLIKLTMYGMAINYVISYGML